LNLDTKIFMSDIYNKILIYIIFIKKNIILDYFIQNTLKEKSIISQLY
jgi:hypothetical protein